jgi:hypothetical protein
MEKYLKLNNYPDIILFPVIESKDNKVKYPIKNENGYNLSHHSCGMLIKKDLHDLFGLYDIEYKICADEKFFRILEKNNINIAIAHEPIGIYNNYGLSSKISPKIINEMFQIEFSIRKFYFLSLINWIVRTVKYYVFKK